MMPPSQIQHEIAANSRASAKIFRYLDQRGIEHSRQISGATLGAVLGVDSRTWRRYVGGDREMPTMARRLLSLVSGIDFEAE